MGLQVNDLVVEQTMSAATLTATTLYVGTNNIGGVTSNFNILSATTFSAGTIYSGSTNLYDIFLTTNDGNDITRVQPGSNVSTGGTGNLPTINLVSSPSINGLTFSGSAIGNTFSANTVSGGTLYSGSTNLYDIFATVPDQNDVTRVQNGTNTYTGGTATLPTVNVSALTINTIIASGSSTFTGGLSANTLSGGTILSGSTNLYSIFATIPDQNDVTRIQPGINTYTGGTNNNPTINVSALTVNTISASGSSTFIGGLSANTLSGGTILSGSTNLYNIFHQKNGYKLQKAGSVTGSTFAGNPKIATVTFSTPFSDINYAITISSDANRTWTWESKTASGFTINANSNTAFNSGNVNWTATENGEGYR